MVVGIGEEGVHTGITAGEAGAAEWAGGRLVRLKRGKVGNIRVNSVWLLLGFPNDISMFKTFTCCLYLNSFAMVLNAEHSSSLW